MVTLSMLVASTFSLHDLAWHTMLPRMTAVNSISLHQELELLTVTISTPFRSDRVDFPFILPQSTNCCLSTSQNRIWSIVDDATFELLPAERKDIPRLVHIHSLAYLPDNLFRLLVPNLTEFEKVVTQMLEVQIAEPTWQHLKVVDKKTGVLAAWAAWETPTRAQIRERDEIAAAKWADPEKGKTKGEIDILQQLSHYVQADIDRWRFQCMIGKRHILCEGLYTEPSFQRQGMGSALVKYGNGLADQAKLPIILQASPIAYPLYAKHGFETDQCLDVDLRKWVPRGKSNDKGYGNYQYRYMLRLPQTLPRISL